MTIEQLEVCANGIRNAIAIRDVLQIEWIESVLCNDENSSNAELLAYFMDEDGITEREARHYVNQRQAALLSSVSTDAVLSFRLIPYEATK